MIKKLNLKFGSSPKQPPLETDLTPITVFVGPNNSGKSKVLTEIEKFCKNGLPDSTTVILADVEFNDLIDTEAEILNFTLSPKENESLRPNHVFFGKEKTRHQIDKKSLRDILSSVNSNKNAYVVYYLSFNTIRIDGASRINLINAQSAGDLQSHPMNSLQVLFQNNSKRKELRRIIFDAFKKYFVIDPTHLGHLRI